jgi:hypothetical protein
MKKLIAFLGLSLLVSLVAFAAPSNIDMDGASRWMKLGFWAGPTAASVATNKVTNVLGASTTYDALTTTSGCDESASITVTGAKLGDPCMVGAPTATGALALSVTCYVFATNAVRIKVCNPTIGAIDPASGTYYVRVISAQ